jgi:hypothetical protein
MTNRNSLPLKHLNELPVNYFYRIYRSKRLQKKYGQSLLVYLFDYDTKEKFTVFLPKRYNNMIPDDDSDSDDDESDNMPKSIGFLDYFDVAFTGASKSNNIPTYNITFKRSDYPYMFP